MGIQNKTKQGGSFVPGGRKANKEVRAGKAASILERTVFLLEILHEMQSLRLRQNQAIFMTLKLFSLDNKNRSLLAI